MKIGKPILGICCCLLCVAALQAGKASDSASMGRNGWFTYAPYGKSLLSDVHPDFVRFEVVGNTNHQAFDFTHSGKKYRPSTQGCFGMDLPVGTAISVPTDNSASASPLPHRLIWGWICLNHKHHRLSTLTIESVCLRLLSFIA